MVGDLGERVEAILGQNHRTAGLQQENLGAAANGVRIVDHHHLDALQRILLRQCILPRARHGPPGRPNVRRTVGVKFATVQAN